MSITPIEAREDCHAAATAAERKTRIHDAARRLHGRVAQAQREANSITESLEVARAEMGDVGHLEDRIYELADVIGEAREEMYGLVAEAIGDERYSADDIRAWDDLSFVLTGVRATFDVQVLDALVTVERVPNAPFRAAYERLIAGDDDSLDAIIRMTHSALCHMEEMGHENYGAAGLIEDGKTQRRVFKRWLGLEPPAKRRGVQPALRLFVSYHQAVALSMALGLTLHEAGI